MNYKKIQNLQKHLINPLLIKKKENLFYLTGRSFDYQAEEYLLVTPSPRPSPRGRRGLAVGFGSGLEQIDWIRKTDRLKNLGKYLQSGKQLDIEYGFTYGEGKYLKLKLPKVKINPTRSAVDVMRQVKDAEEIALIKKSMQIVEKVFKLVRREIKKPGITEIKLAQFIQSAGLKFGGQDISFPAIVASGANAAIPHHVPGAKKLKAGESIIIDFGFKYKNYCSDFTRTVFLKTAPKKLADAYNQTEKSYNESIDFINESMSLRGGQGFSWQTKQSFSTIRLLRSARNDKQVTAGNIYQKSVEVLAEKHLDRYFIHSLGHGTGLEIHELPNLSPNSKDILRNGMVFSIEPGVYFPNIGGIRIEDLVYLEKDRVKKFINVSTKLEDNIL